MDSQPPSNWRSKPRKKPPKLHLVRLEDLDQRTAAAQATRDMIAALTSDLGGDLSAARAALVKRVAVLAAVIEDAESKWLRGQSPDMSAWLMALDRFHRILSSLGLDRQAREVDMKEYLGLK